VATESVEQGKEKDPDDIHEMSVQPRELDRREIRWREMATPGLPGKHGEDPKADDHMQGMHARHAEIETEEELHLGGMRSFDEKRMAGHQMFFELMSILHALDAQKYQSQLHGEKQKAGECLTFPRSRITHG
jgi:hypothetical protein